MATLILKCQLQCIYECAGMCLSIYFGKTSSVRIISIEIYRLNSRIIQLKEINFHEKINRNL